VTGADLADLANYFVQDGEVQMGNLAKFLRAVGVDLGFLQVMAEIPNEGSKVLPPDQLRSLNITTSFTTTDWRVTPSKLVHGFQLDGTTAKHSRPNLLDLVSIVCDDKRLGMIVHYVPDRSDTRMDPSFWDASLANLNRRLTAVGIDAGGPSARFTRSQIAVLGQNVADHFAVSLPFTSMLEQALRRGLHMQVSFEINDEVQVNRPIQPDYKAADHKTGFTADLSSGREMITSFLDNCR
jgi:hypothetical protein